MPESKSRKKKTTRSREPQEQQVAAAPQGNPRWLVPTMLTLMILGLIWIVVTYVTSTEYPIASLGNFNLAIGFALLFGGFALTLRWR